MSLSLAIPGKQRGCLPCRLFAVPGTDPRACAGQARAPAPQATSQPKSFQSLAPQEKHLSKGRAVCGDTDTPRSRAACRTPPQQTQRHPGASKNIHKYSDVPRNPSDIQTCPKMYRHIQKHVTCRWQGHLRGDF